MYNYIISYLTSNSNYSLMNINNIYNCMINIFEILNEEQKSKFINIIKINVGKKFIHDFKLYIFEKVPDHDILKYF